MDEINAVLKKVSQVNIEKHIRQLEGVRHPVFAPEALNQTGEYIFQQLQALGYETTYHHFDEGGNKYSNILSTRKGAQLPQKKVLVMAHFDTVAASPGADDNASGVAALLECARVLCCCEFSKSLVFTAVNLEEQGVNREKNSPICLGSSALASHARAQGWDIEGVVNFESIAYADDAYQQTAPKNSPLVFPEQGNFIAIVGNEHSAVMVRNYAAAIQEYQIPLPFMQIIVPGKGEVLPDSRRSDHAPFWDSGYRAIMLTDTANFRSPHYHKPSDKLETLNLAFAADVCRAATALVYQMAA